MYYQTLSSKIAGYYKGKTLFITGATGFVGKVLIEKLLRSCSDIKNIYVLIRPKKGVDSNARLNELLDYKLFDNLKRTCPGIHEKLIPVNGDLMEPNLGISKEDEEKLCRDVNVVFHSAATVKFNEPLKLAVDINVTGLKKMIDLAKNMQKLEAFTHVSTAYANCDRHLIEEKVYEPPMKYSDIKTLCEILDEDLRNHLESKLIKQRPNTYTLTKAIAESILMEYQKEIPCVIVRPSIIGATWKDPFPGWIDNFAAGSGVLALSDKGLLMSMIGDRSKVVDFIPVDSAVNLMISAAWYRGTRQTTETLVYNNTSGSINPIRLAEFIDHCNLRLGKSALTKLLLPNFNMTLSRSQHAFNVFLKQIMPANLMDLYLKLIGKKPKFSRIQNNVLNNSKNLEYFTTHDFKYKIDNIEMLQSKMNNFDAMEFNFDIRELNWPSYFEQYVLGLKEHCLKEDISKIMPKFKVMSRL